MKIPRSLLKGMTVFVLLSLVGWVVVIRVMPVFQDIEEDVPEMQAGNSGAGRMQKIPVQAYPAKIGDLIMKITAQGTVRPFREIPIVSQASGRLVSLPVFEGQPIKKAKRIARIDDTEYKLSYNDAEATLNKARLDNIFMSGDIQEDPANNGSTKAASKRDVYITRALNEWRDADRLLKEGKINKTEYDNRKDNYDTAQALSGNNRDQMTAVQSGLASAKNGFERAKIDLENTLINSPINGIIAELQVQKDHYISNGTQICKVIDMSKVLIKTAVLEPEIGYLEIGRSAKIVLSAYPGEVFTGTVKTISPVIIETTCEVVIEVDNPEGRIKPGMYAFVTIDAQIFKDRLIVPKEALQTRQNRDLIFAVREDRAVWNYVTVGLRNDEYIEILDAKEGLIPGEQVIISGHYTLGHDVPVRIVKALQKQ